MPIKVSIIVPCYNIAPFVDQCLKCLTKQTLRDIEIICIDDKSTDNTLELLNEYAVHDKRIKIIALKPNMGVSCARNAGMAAARGEYIGFMDPDDLIDENFYEVLYNLAKTTNADIAKGAVRHIKTDGTIEIRPENELIQNNKYNFEQYFWSAIYRRKFIETNQIQFPAGLLISEDLVFLMHAVHHANKIATTNDVYYSYYRRENSADSHKLSTPKIDSGIAAIHHMIEWACALPPTMQDEKQHVINHTFNIATYLANKDIKSYDADKLLDLFIRFGTIFGDYVFYIRPRVIRAMREANHHELRKLLFSKNTRWRLFGMIPTLKKTVLSGYHTKYLLFDYIPVLTIRPRGRKTKIYSFGIPLLTIKR